MKTKLCFTIILLSLFFFSPLLRRGAGGEAFSQSPNWLWAKGMGGTNNDIGYSIAIDASGNVYTTGHFSGTVDFDPGIGVYNLTHGGCFFSKLDASGNFVWAKEIFWQVIGYSIEIDTAGNGDVYTTGLFYGTIDFDPDSSGIFNLTAAPGSFDIFISKLDSSGNFVWAKRMGGTGYDEGRSIAVDPAGSGDVYTTGRFSGTADFDPGPGVYNLTSAGNYEIFISKLDSSGNFVWAKAMGGTDSDIAYSIAIDPTGSGDVYTTGFFIGTVDFDPDSSGIFNLTSAGSYDIFISKLDGSGNFIWAKAIGGASVSGDIGYSIAIEPSGSGDVYTTGVFAGIVDFDPDTGIFNLTGNGIFISKLDSSGNFVWAKAIVGTNSAVGFSIALDPAGSGDVYTTGYFHGTVDFDPDSMGIFNLTGNAIFLSKLDSSGNFVWAKAMGGGGGGTLNHGYSIAFNTSGNLYITGMFNSIIIDFDTISLTNADNSGYTSDIFIAKLGNSTTGIENIENMNGISVFPNPVISEFTIYDLGIKIYGIEIYDMLGQIVFQSKISPDVSGLKSQITIDVSKWNAGIYVVQIKSESFIETKKFIVVK